MVKKNAKKMDPKMVSKQKAEIAYVAKRSGAKQSVVRDVQNQVGRSRAKVYAKLREMGYTIKTRTHK